VIILPGHDRQTAAEHLIAEVGPAVAEGYVYPADVQPPRLHQIDGGDQAFFFIPTSWVLGCVVQNLGCYGVRCLPFSDSLVPILYT